MNEQPIEKRIDLPAVDVHSVFRTIQGEGPFTGTPAVFIRLAGCNLRCPGCDTDYTKGRQKYSVKNVVEQVLNMQSCGLVVITGGEPFRQVRTGDLIHALTNAGFYVQIESNGTLPPPAIINFNLNTEERSGAYLVCSPKSGAVNPSVWESACCVKYVLHHQSVAADGLPVRALHHSVRVTVARPPHDWYKPIYIQPMDCKNEIDNQKNLEAAIHSTMKHGYILQLQIHKIINME